MALVPFQLALVPLSFLERLRPSGLAPLKLKVEACESALSTQKDENPGLDKTSIACDFVVDMYRP